MSVERPEYEIRTMEDSDDVERVAAHYGLNAGALAAARDAQGSLSASGLGPVIAAYVDALPADTGSERSPRCGCSETCGDDGDIDGPGTCKGLPRAPEPPLVEVVMVPRVAALGVRSDTEGAPDAR